MPLSDAEKERIRETEALKDEIRKELPQAKSDSGLPDLWKQLILLVVGFLLTAVVGGCLTAFWKDRDSKNQREYLARQRALDKAYSLVERASKETATTIAAADDILATYQGDDWTSKDVDERRENWTKTSRTWRVNCQVLRAEMAANFPNQQIVTVFDEIIKKRRQLGNGIFNLPRDKKAIKPDEDLKKEVDDAIDLNNKIIDLLEKCDTLIAAQARKMVDD